MKRLFPMIISASLVLASMAHSEQGFDADSVRTFLEKRMVIVPKDPDGSSLDNDQLLLLGREIAEFRDGAVLGSTTAAMLKLPQVMPGSLKAFQGGEISSRFPYIWPYVMAGSFIVIGNALGDDPIAALYNPYYDVAILTRWEFMDEKESQTGPGFRLVDAVPITGRAFHADRPSLPTDQPVWTGSKTTFEVCFVEAAQNFVADFERRYPPFGRQSVALPTAGTKAAVKVIEDRVFFLLKWLIDAQDASAPVNYAAEIKLLRGALSSSFPDRLEKILPPDNPQNAGLFFRLDQPIRAGMKPYLVVDRNVIFLDPINLATGFISVHYRPAEKGFSVGTMALFNLEARYPVK